MKYLAKIGTGMASAAFAAIALAGGDGAPPSAFAAGPTIVDIALEGDPAPGAGRDLRVVRIDVR